MTINLCRICLATEASLPIFDDGESGFDIQANLAMCLKEKVEDHEGYPRYICEECNNMLSDFCKFLNKYRETCKILEKGLDIVKEEDEDDYSCDEPTEEEVPKSIKEELVLEDNVSESKKHDIFKKVLYVKLERLEIPLLPFKPLKRTHSASKSLEVSNKIASSILEGEFSWNGTEWCVSSKSISNKIEKPKQIVTTKGRKKFKIPKLKIKKPNPPKLCDICGEVFKSRERLTVHKKRAHYNVRSPCKYCSKTFNCIYDLRRHVLRKHEKNKDFVCAICGKGFAFKGGLTAHHKSVHDDKKPKKSFKCKFCNKTYKCFKSVEIHERSAHTGYRPAACTVCEARFFHEEYLKEHMRLHTGETPFKCPICKRGYAQRGNMKSHMKTHKRSEVDDDTMSKLKPNYLKLLKS